MSSCVMRLRVCLECRMRRTRTRRMWALRLRMAEGKVRRRCRSSSSRASALRSMRTSLARWSRSDLFKLKKVDVTFQNLDSSSEISLTDESHYFDSDPTKGVQSLGDDEREPMTFIADTTTAKVRTLSETVRLDARTKLLNPKFCEGMLATGYEGAREVTKRLLNTMGWSAAVGDVNKFIYEDANETFITDEKMSNRLLETNPNTLRDMATTFLEANGRGYWDTSDENLNMLRGLYQEGEDRFEGLRGCRGWSRCGVGCACNVCGVGCEWG